MKKLALVTTTVVGSLCTFAQGATELETLRTRCAEQERQITQLESKIDNLNSLIERNQHQALQQPKVNTTPLKANDVLTNGSTTYKVKKGDTISKIAKQHKVSSESIVRANKLANAGRIVIGQTLKIPTTAATLIPQVTSQPIAKAIPVASATSSKPSQTSSTKPERTKQEAKQNLKQPYTVKSGDTLYRISRQTGVSVANILKANPGIKPNKLAVGQTIQLANTASNSRTTTSVAKQTTAKSQETKTQKVHTAQKTNTTTTSQPAKAAPTRPKAQSQPVKHAPKITSVRAVKVDKQMTFGEFCSAHGTTVEQVNELNGHALTKSQYLAKGSELYVPATQH